MNIAAKRRELKGYLKKKYNPYFNAILQFLNMGKDAVDTIKPYKSKTHLQRDLLQPINGLYNLGLAAMSLFFVCVWLVLFLFTPIIRPFIKNPGNSFAQMMGECLYQAAGHLLNAVALAIRGITQFITAPLTLLRVAARGIYAAIKGWQPFHENEGIKHLVGEGENVAKHHYSRGTLSAALSIHQQLNNKLQKALQQGQPVFMAAKQNAVSPFGFFEGNARLVDYYNDSLGNRSIFDDKGKELFTDYISLFGNTHAEKRQQSGEKNITLKGLNDFVKNYPLPKFE